VRALWRDQPDKSFEWSLHCWHPMDVVLFDSFLGNINEINDDGR